MLQIAVDDGQYLTPRDLPPSNDRGGEPAFSLAPHHPQLRVHRTQPCGQLPRPVRAVVVDNDELVSVAECGVQLLDQLPYQLGDVRAFVEGGDHHGQPQGHRRVPLGRDQECAFRAHGQQSSLIESRRPFLCGGG